MNKADQAAWDEILESVVNQEIDKANTKAAAKKKAKDDGDDFFSWGWTFAYLIGLCFGGIGVFFVFVFHMSMGMEKAQEEKARNETECYQCLETINIEARKCKHCGSKQ